MEDLLAAATLILLMVLKFVGSCAIWVLIPVGLYRLAVRWGFLNESHDPVDGEELEEASNLVELD